MEAGSAVSAALARGNRARGGRPTRELAGQVEERILEAAGQVFLARGFSGASVDEIAEVARAGKPTIYARFPGKEALFAAVIERRVRQNIGVGVTSSTGATIEERLESLAANILTRLLVPETIGMMRVVVADVSRFPDLAASVSRMARERQTEAIGRLLVELGESDRTTGLPAFAPDRLSETARRFLDSVLAPMALRALFGENLATLHAEIAAHVAHATAFFLAGCGVRSATR